ncbi:MAG: DNA polymerase IV, partial [Lachnospiraceae bacterium]|nr:DNA polymerase IV [Lachnospiraceae bacterium]
IDPSDWYESEQKGYGNSTTTAVDTTDLKTASSILMMLSDQVAGRIRRDKVYASCVCVSARFSDFDHISRQMTLKTPTSSTNDIYEHAIELLQSFWNEDRPIRQLGVRATKVTSEKYEQLSLFDLAQDEVLPAISYDTAADELSDKRMRADKAMDELKAKMGKDVIKRGNEL